jgi:peptidoglycan/xylan/chitin deacetylase (PgdA/CDA1 family)
MQFLKQAFKTTLGRSVKVLPGLRRFVSNGLTIFLFHDVTDEPSPFNAEYGLAVSRDRFHRQVTWIRENFSVVHPDRLIAAAALPERAALITFDDGFLGTFENGLDILGIAGMPAVVFLNMGAILEGTPILSVVACYLSRYEPRFAQFATSVGLRRPYHLTLTPQLLADFEHRCGPIDRAAVLQYQGPFASLGILRKWHDRERVVYGSHLFDHWNAHALSDAELEAQYQANQAALAQLENSVKLFAFPNGQPMTCFTQRDVDCVRRLGASKAFSAWGGVNRDPAGYLLGRFSLADHDRDENHLWFRLGRAAAGDLLAAYRK